MISKTMVWSNYKQPVGDLPLAKIIYENLIMW